MIFHSYVNVDQGVSMGVSHVRQDAKDIRTDALVVDTHRHLGVSTPEETAISPATRANSSTKR